MTLPPKTEYRIPLGAKTPVYEFTGTERFLSNFYPSKIVYEGGEYTCIESAFQAAKTLDLRLRQDFQKNGVYADPSKAKRRGRRLDLRPDWEDVKESVMLDLLRIKFHDPLLAGMLMATGDRPLIEGNTWNDTYWGVCANRGMNRLGILLMQVRSEL